MTKSISATLHFPITSIDPQFAANLRNKLLGNILSPRLSDTEQLWLEHTTEHATQFDIVCYQFATLEDANEYAEEISLAISHEVTAFIAEKGAEALADIW